MGATESTLNVDSPTPASTSMSTPASIVPAQQRPTRYNANEHAQRKHRRGSSGSGQRRSQRVSTATPTSTHLSPRSSAASVITLRGLLLGLPVSGKQTLLQRLKGNDHFVHDDDGGVDVDPNHDPSKHGETEPPSTQITIPYQAPHATPDHIRLIVESSHSVPQHEEKIDFAVLLVNPRHDPRNIKTYIFKIVAMLLQTAGCPVREDNDKTDKATSTNNNGEHSRTNEHINNRRNPVCLCLLLNFRDKREGSATRERIQESDLLTLAQQAMEHYNPTLSQHENDTDKGRDDITIVLQCHTTSLLNCYGLEHLHHFIYVSYLQRKQADYETQLVHIQNELRRCSSIGTSSSSNTSSTTMSYDDFMRNTQVAAAVTATQRKEKSTEKSKGDRRGRHAEERQQETNEQERDPQVRARRTVVTGHHPTIPTRQRHAATFTQNQNPKEALDAFFADDDDDDNDDDGNNNESRKVLSSPTRQGKERSNWSVTNNIDDDEEEDDDFFIDDGGQRHGDIPLYEEDDQDNVSVTSQPRTKTNVAEGKETTPVMPQQSGEQKKPNMSTISESSAEQNKSKHPSANDDGDGDYDVSQTTPPDLSSSDSLADNDTLNVSDAVQLPVEESKELSGRKDTQSIKISVSKKRDVTEHIESTQESGERSESKAQSITIKDKSKKKNTPINSEEESEGDRSFKAMPVSRKEAKSTNQTDATKTDWEVDQPLQEDTQDQDSSAESESSQHLAADIVEKLSVKDETNIRPKVGVERSNQKGVPSRTRTTSESSDEDFMIESSSTSGAAPKTNYAFKTRQGSTLKQNSSLDRTSPVPNEPEGTDRYTKNAGTGSSSISAAALAAIVAAQQEAESMMRQEDNDRSNLSRASVPVTKEKKSKKKKKETDPAKKEKREKKKKREESLAHVN